MAGFARSLVAEAMKYRRTAALWLATGIPVLIIGLAWVALTQSDLANAETERKWRALRGITAQSWVTMCLPIGGAILIGLLWGLEHGSNQLKHVLAQPPSRHATFWAKTTGIFALIALGTALLGVLCSLLALVLGMGPVRWDVAFGIPFRAYAASLPTIALVSWVAQRFTSFTWPLILGVVGIVVGGIAAQSDEYWHLVPWAWSIIGAMGANHDSSDTAIVLALASGTLVLGASWVHFWRADTPG